MDAVTLINQHINVEKLLEYYDFDKIHTDGDMIRSCCKLHGGNNPTAFVINTESGLWYCHTGDCGGGDLYTLVQKMENLEFPQAVQWLANFFGVDIRNLKIMERKAEYIEELKKFIRVMRNRKKKQTDEFHITEEIKQVAKYRNFQKSTLNHFGLGYVESVQLKKRSGEEYTLYQRLVFPIIFNNKQIGISFRRIKNTDYPKWSHQPAHLETRNILYNYDAVLGKSKIVVCEGITDVWAWFEIDIPAVATFGAHLTDEQYKLLLKTGADIVLAYDGDEAGRLATEKAIKMLRYKANVEVVCFNDGEDPESISREELRKRYEGRKRMECQSRRN